MWLDLHTDKKLTEEGELDKRREFVLKNNANKEAICLLDKLSNEYVSKYYNI